MLRFSATVYYSPGQWEVFWDESADRVAEIREALSLLSPGAEARFWPGEDDRTLEIVGYLQGELSVLLVGDLRYAIDRSGGGEIIHFEAAPEQRRPSRRHSAFPPPGARCPGCGRPRPPHATNCPLS